MRGKDKKEKKEAMARMRRSRGRSAAEEESAGSAAELFIILPPRDLERRGTFFFISRTGGRRVEGPDWDLQRRK